MKPGWKTRPDERQYFEAKLAARQPKPKPKKARATKTEAALAGILRVMQDTIEVQFAYLGRIAVALEGHDKDKSIQIAINDLKRELRATLGGIEQNLIAIYGAMPPEQRDKDIRIMRDALLAMSNGLPSHRG